MEILNLNNSLEKAKMSAVVRKLFFASMLIFIFNGYALINNTSINFIIAEWALTPDFSGMVAVATIIGIIVGSIVFGILTDKFENKHFTRKKVIIYCFILFSLFNALCFFSKSVESFVGLRFIVGIGLGGVMPNILTLVSEYMPKYFKPTSMIILFSGCGIGGLLSEVISRNFIGQLGWEIMFLFSMMPILFIAMFINFIPESVNYLVRSQQLEKAELLLNNIGINKDVVSETSLAKQNLALEKTPFLALFRNKFKIVTLLFWLGSFLCIFMNFGLTSTLPKLLMLADYDVVHGLGYFIALNLGGGIGSMFAGIMSERFRLDKLLYFMLSVGIAALYLMSMLYNHNPLLTYACIVLGCAASLGGQEIIVTLIGLSYDLKVRSTALGCTLGIGHLGIFLGIVLEPNALSSELPLSLRFALLSIPCVLILVCAFLMNLRKKSVSINTDYELIAK